jgi:hypothetical protein
LHDMFMDMAMLVESQVQTWHLFYYWVLLNFFLSLDVPVFYYWVLLKICFNV